MDSNATERYDRQIRLWGQHGQDKCYNSKICLINADSFGMEILKGLCLAGVGSFTILDSHKVTQDDIDCTFIARDKIGKSRGEVAKAVLSDLNEEANCSIYPLEAYLPHMPSQIIACQSLPNEDSSQNDQFWKQFDCVIASGSLCTNQTNRLSRSCWKSGTPLIQCKSIGFYGYLKNQLKEHIVTDTHPEWRPANHDPNKPDTAVISTRPLFEDFDNKSCDLVKENDEDESLTEFICLKAVDLFYSTYGRLPGHTQDSVETDVVKLKDCAKKLIGKLKDQFKTLDQCLYELSRYGGAELHVTSAFMGGCVSQEVIKILTHQYVPVDDTLVYNAMTALTKTFKYSEIVSVHHRS